MLSMLYHNIICICGTLNNGVLKMDFILILRNLCTVRIEKDFRLLVHDPSKAYG